MQLIASRRCTQHAEGACEERPLILASPQRWRADEHVELSGLWPRSERVGRSQHGVGAELLARGDHSSAAAERGENAVGCHLALAGAG